MVNDFSFNFSAKETFREKPSHQIALEKEDSMQGSATNRESAETSHKNEPAPNVGLEPTTLRLRVSCSTD